VVTDGIDKALARAKKTAASAAGIFRSANCPLLPTGRRTH
jgi:hypothetical protein